MSATVFPQYAKTTSPEVAKTHSLNQDALDSFRKKAKELTDKYGGTGYLSGCTFDATKYMSGIISETEPTSGRWKRFGSREDYWRPWRNNPAAAVMRCVRYEPERLPGAISSAWQFDRATGGSHIFNYIAFALDGVIYTGCSAAGDEHDENNFCDWEPTWTEITAGEFKRALATYNERQQES